MTYREQAMDAGYTGDELEQVAQMLEYQDQMAEEQYWKEQQQLEEYYATLQPCTCDVCRDGGECPDRELI